MVISSSSSMLEIDIWYELWFEPSNWIYIYTGDDKDQFNERIQSIIVKCSGNNLIRLMRDINNKVGMHNMGYGDIMGWYELTRRKKERKKGECWEMC